MLQDVPVKPAAQLQTQPAALEYNSFVPPGGRQRGGAASAGGWRLQAKPPALSAAHHLPAVELLTGWTHSQLPPPAAPAARWNCRKELGPVQVGGSSAARVASSCACMLARLSGAGAAGSGCACAPRGSRQSSPASVRNGQRSGRSRMHTRPLGRDA